MEENDHSHKREPWPFLQVLFIVVLAAVGVGMVAELLGFRMKKPSQMAEDFESSVTAREVSEFQETVEGLCPHLCLRKFTYVLDHLEEPYELVRGHLNDGTATATLSFYQCQIHLVGPEDDLESVLLKSVSHPGEVGLNPRYKIDYLLRFVDKPCGDDLFEFDPEAAMRPEKKPLIKRCGDYVFESIVESDSTGETYWVRVKRAS